MPRPQLAALLLSSLLVAACASSEGERRFRLLPGVHRFPIQQGNVVTQEMIDQLRPGMTRAQVRFVLGTPLIADTFDQSRWDYLYMLWQPSGKRLREHVTIHFDGDRLVGISGDYLPSGAAVPPGAEPAPGPATGAGSDDG
ncbi:MAG: outer membrane protein assembly factor BamE [Pseudomonadota bacterium]|jgi:outer membrane protein assembly factor BamE